MKADPTQTSPVVTLKGGLTAVDIMRRVASFAHAKSAIQNTLGVEKQQAELSAGLLDEELDVGVITVTGMPGSKIKVWRIMSDNI